MNYAKCRYPLMSLILIFTVLLTSCANGSGVLPSESSPLPPQTVTSPELLTEVSTDPISDESISESITEIEAVVVSPNLTTQASVEPDNQPVENQIQGQLTVHFLDVGQADSILVQLPTNEVLLIDAGNNGDDDFIIEYLNKLKIVKIDYLIGTHPHEDHIGALDDIILNFDIGSIYMPKATSTTKTFEDVLLAIDSKKLKINSAKANVELLSYDNLKAYFVAPNGGSYDDLNDYSAVIKLEYGNTSFLFTGDAETVSENEILNNDYVLTADVLKIGHHGSNSSSSDKFLTAVNPKYAVISCGTDNTYGHPTEDTLKRLQNHDIDLFRTDLQGTIVISSNGNKLEFNQSKLDYSAMLITPEPSPTPTTTVTPKPTPKATATLKPTEESTSQIVYITKTGEKYHRGSCSYLSKSKIEIDLQSAKSQGYTPCSRCKP